MKDPVGGLMMLPPRRSAWASDAAADGNLAPAIPAGHAGTLRVLLVEDNPGDAQLVRYALRETRSPVFQVTHVATLAAAIAAVTGDGPFDVVLLDLSLPDSAGLNTLSRLQRVSARVPIVIMTGFDDPLFADHALEVGAQDYLVKSDDPERTVVRAIRYAMTRMNAQIEREALAERVAEQQRTLLAELAAARAMQFDLLPRPERLAPLLRTLALDVEAAFEPSTGIGGDLWGCMECGAGRIAFYTFDFCGHGIGAALNVFRMHTLIADHWDARQAPADLLHVLGGALSDLLTRGQFATMFLGIVDTARGDLEWAAAGAPAPILVNGGQAQFLDSRGYPLGLVHAPTYASHRVAFPPGASLLLYSDALTDSPRPDGTAFGERDLMGLVDAQLDAGGPVSMEGLLEQYYRHVPPPLPDDLTALRITRVQPG